MFYFNYWEAQSFPFLSQLLFYKNGTEYNQDLILTSSYDLNQTALDIQGVPYFAMTNAIYYVGNNLAIGAQITFVACFFHKQIWAAVKDWRRGTHTDPHYKVMIANYSEVPMWWYATTFVLSFAVAMGTCYAADSHLPWWGLIVAIFLSGFVMPFAAVMNAITGFAQGFDGVAQMIGGVILPGNPQTNLWFTLYGSTVGDQGVLILADLKLGKQAVPQTLPYFQCTNINLSCT